MTVEQPAAEPSASKRLWALVDAGIFVASELQLDTVLDRIVAIACRVVGAQYGALGVINEERTGLSTFIFRGISEGDRERIGALPVGKGLLGALIADPRPIRLADLSSDPRSAGFPPNHPPMKTFLGVPVTAKGSVFGNLYLTEKEGGGPFTDEDQELAVALASQAGIAIENARLYQQATEKEAISTRRLRELETVQEVGAALLGELNPGRVLRVIARSAKELVGADAAVIALYDEGADDLRIRVAVGHHAGAVEGMRIPVRGSLSGQVMRLLQPLVVDDALRLPETHVPMIQALEARSVIFAPLVERGLGVGTLAVMHRDVGHFGDEEFFGVRRFADLGSLALRNARLVDAERRQTQAEADLAAARAREESRAEMLRAVIRAQEDQQQRISRELHDSIGQALTSVLLALQLVEQEALSESVRGRMEDLRRLTMDAAVEVRRMAFELRPTVLDDLGLASAFERYTSDLAERTGITVDLSVDVGDRRLEAETETVLYRVMQEATTNAARSANPSRISVSLATTNGVATLRVADNGAGFDLRAVEGKGLGLRGMKERAELVGGTLSISSTPGEGSVISLEVPLEAR